jgi:hypothetical protein
VLAVRDGRLASVLADLHAGAQVPGFCQAIIGDGDIGKTVLLNEIVRRVTTEVRWPVLARQATPGDS